MGFDLRLVVITRRWCDKNNLEMYGVTRQSAQRAYFLAAASIFEPSLLPGMGARSGARRGYLQVLAEEQQH
jgi:hypothetical protein